MNTEVFFQTMNSNSAVKRGNAQMLRAGGSSTGSFKKEMDQIFERKQSRSNDSEKSSITKDSRTSGKVQQKEEPENVPDSGVNAEKKDSCTDVTPEEQALAAAQIQQPVLLAANDLNGIANALQQTQAQAVTTAPIAANLAEMPLHSTENMQTAAGTEEGEIKLPFQNSADLVKSSMIQPKQSGGQENQTPDFAENQTKGSLLAGKQAQEKSNASGESLGMQHVTAAKEESVSELPDLVQENVPMKNNMLDLSKVNIKVADAPVDMNQADAAQQLADKILYKLNAGKQEFDLELNPRDLGKVNIKMIFQNGSAELIMSTSNAKAHQLLSAQADTLRAILEANTGADSTVNIRQTETTDGQFDRDNFQQQKDSQQNQQNHQQERKTTSEISFADRLRLGLVNDWEEAV